MKTQSRLVVQADDVAITRRGTLGAIDSIANGIVRNAGLFTNRPDSKLAAERLRDFVGIDVGIDINLVTGSPILPPREVKGLVDEHGRFRSSRSIRAAYPVRQQDGLYTFFENDPFDYEQSLAEARAQIERFVDLMLRPPAYVHHHSLMTEVTDAVLHQVADEFDLLLVDDLHRFGRLHMVDAPWYRDTTTLATQAESDPLSAIESVVREVAAHELSLLIIHPGYIDAELLDISTLSLTRARDVAFASSPRLAHQLDEAGIELVTYSEIACELELDS